ncbi:MAG: ABC transporter ATP-binding protein [Lachnospira sp.]|nr:ABC transporter ATP-binding protein [Lachnospira sp.]
MRRLIRYFHDEIRFLVLLLILTAAAVVASVMAPVFQSSAIDAIVAGSFGVLPEKLKTMVILYVISGLSLLLQGSVSASLSQRIVRKLRTDLFQKIVNLPVRYLDTHSHGDIMSRMTNDAENISDVISSSLGTMFSGILTLAGTLALMLWYSVPLTLLSCTTVIAVVLVTQLIRKKMSGFFLKRQVLLGTLNGDTEEKITNLRTIIACSRQEDAIRSFTKTSDELTRTGIIAEIIGGSMGPVMNTLSNTGFVIVAVFGAWFALKGWITIGVISAFIVYSRQLSRPISELAQLYGQIETALAGAERIFDLLGEPDEDKSGSVLLPDPEGTIEFRDVSFSYDPGKPVIRHFNLRIGKGKKIALVGSTGSGKTTIINLLMRFYNVDSGEILLDGVNIHDILCPSLRRDIGIVLQDTVLFSDTVRANLTYGASDAEGSPLPVTQEQLDRAAGISRCDRLIRTLPQGYDTFLTLAGASLSQGERQLIAIGRAFLSDPKILILDEATSNVDTRTEKDIQDAMITLMKGRTSLIIAHRLSTIQDADTIVVMDHGRITETGSHEELLAKKGAYYRLYMTQFAGSDT